MITDPNARSVLSPDAPNPRLDHWEQRYSTDDYLFGTAPNVFLRSQHHRLKPGQRALAVADGEGRNGVWLAQKGLDVLSVEGAANALAKARQLAEREGVTLQFEQADLLHWQWPESEFDVVVAIFIQFLSPLERETVFAAMKSALKPGGLLIVQGYTPRQLDFRTGGPSSLEQLYTEELLRDLLDDMKILEMREHESIINEGTGHSGMSGLIDAVGQRVS